MTHGIHCYDRGDFTANQKLTLLQTAFAAVNHDLFQVVPGRNWAFVGGEAISAQLQFWRKGSGNIEFMVSMANVYAGQPQAGYEFVWHTGITQPIAVLREELPAYLQSVAQAHTHLTL